MDQPLGLATSDSTTAVEFAVAPWRAFADTAGWDALAGRASEPNPFAERWCVEPALAAFDTDAAVALATLTIGGSLAAILPLVRRANYERYPLPNIGNWLHANAFCGAPLVATGTEHLFWRELLAWCDAHAGAALFLHFEAMPLEGPVYAALREVCAAEHRRAAVVHCYDRALLASHLAPDAYFSASMSSKKRKELRRQANRLADEGTVRFERLDDCSGLEAWIDAFLALERAGWKGAERSALACDPAKAAFFAEALRGAASAGRLERLAITLDDAPIAMLANFLTPPGSYSFKTAFDERFARYSPGVLLQRENLALLGRDDIDWCDSCATADHPMIERIWREKRTIARVSVAIGGKLRRAAFHQILRAELAKQSRRS